MSLIVLAAEVPDIFERARCRAPDVELISEHGLLLAFPDADDDRTVVAVDEKQKYLPYLNAWRDDGSRKFQGEPGGRWSIGLARDPDTYSVDTGDVFAWKTRLGTAVQMVVECIMSLRIPDWIIQSVGADWAHPDGYVVEPAQLQYAMEALMSRDAGFDARELRIDSYMTSQGMGGVIVDDWIRLEHVHAFDPHQGEGHGWVVSAPGWPDTAFWWLGASVRLVARAVLWRRNNLEEVVMQDPARTPPCVVSVPEKYRRSEEEQEEHERREYEADYYDDDD
jgi:hypothetical protein